jgi:CRISPR-associated protein Cmr1
VLSKAALEHTGCTRPLARCLDLDWPHAIGTDAKGALVWRSKDTFRDWRAAMKFLAQTKIGFRVALGFVGGQPHREPQARHVLAYPVTHHKVPAWEGKDRGRLANTLRFKLQPEPDGSLRALIYHTPCKPTLPHQGIDLLGTWQRVHDFLDNAALTRLPDRKGPP